MQVWKKAPVQPTIFFEIFLFNLFYNENQHSAGKKENAPVQPTISLNKQFIYD